MIGRKSLLWPNAADNAYPNFDNIGFIVPMPASNPRDRQPVTEIAQELARLVDKPCFDGLLRKALEGPR